MSFSKKLFQHNKIKLLEIALIRYEDFKTLKWIETSISRDLNSEDRNQPFQEWLDNIFGKDKCLIIKHFGIWNISGGFYIDENGELKSYGDYYGLHLNVPILKEWVTNNCGMLRKYPLVKPYFEMALNIMENKLELEYGRSLHPINFHHKYSMSLYTIGNEEFIKFV